MARCRSKISRLIHERPAPGACSMTCFTRPPALSDPPSQVSFLVGVPVRAVGLSPAFRHDTEPAPLPVVFLGPQHEMGGFDTPSVQALSFAAGTGRVPVVAFMVNSEARKILPRHMLRDKTMGLVHVGRNPYADVPGGLRADVSDDQARTDTLGTREKFARHRGRTSAKPEVRT